MAKRCHFCQKKPLVGNLISHSNIKTKTRYMPNLQRVKVVLNGAVQRVYSCTRCLRTVGRIVKPTVSSYQPEAPAQ